MNIDTLLSAIPSNLFVRTALIKTYIRICLLISLLMTITLCKYSLFMISFSITFLILFFLTEYLHLKEKLQLSLYIKTNSLLITIWIYCSPLLFLFVVFSKNDPYQLEVTYIAFLQILLVSQALSFLKFYKLSIYLLWLVFFIPYYRYETKHVIALFILKVAVTVATCIFIVISRHGKFKYSKDSFVQTELWHRSCTTSENVILNSFDYFSFPLFLIDIEIGCRIGSHVLTNLKANELLKTHKFPSVTAMLSALIVEGSSKELLELLKQVQKKVRQHCFYKEKASFTEGYIRYDFDIIACTIGLPEFEPNIARYVNLTIIPVSSKSSEEKTILENFKTSLICSLSHELCTPINTILNILKIMPQHIVRNSYDLREVAISSTELLNNKLHELIDYTQIELGKFRAAEKAFCVGSLFEELRQIFKHEVKDKSNELIFETNSKQKLWIMADRNRIRQLLIKLISNGNKYTTNGIVKVSALENPHDFDITFQVKDTGSGISEERLRLIFSDDPIAERLQEQSLGCTKLPGLGLIITRKVCEHMNSKLKVNSAKGKGSSFSFKLPLCKIPDIENYKENTTSNLGRGPLRDMVARNLVDQGVTQQIAKSFSTHIHNNIEFEKYILNPTEEPYMKEAKTDLDTEKIVEKTKVRDNNIRYSTDIEQIPIEPSIKTCNRFLYRRSSTPTGMEGIVLIADDYIGNRIILSQMLTKLHIKSVQARDGVETCKIVKESLEGTKKYENIELIFMDLDMPEMDGIQAAKNIRIMEDKLNRSKRIPIAVVTAFNTEKDKQICLKAGMQYFYSKPLSFSAVKALAKIHCKGYHESMGEK